MKALKLLNPMKDIELLILENIKSQLKEKESIDSSKIQLKGFSNIETDKAVIKLVKGDCLRADRDLSKGWLEEKISNSYKIFDISLEGEKYYKLLLQDYRSKSVFVWIKRNIGVIISIFLSIIELFN